MSVSRIIHRNWFHTSYDVLDAYILPTIRIQLFSCSVEDFEVAGSRKLFFAVLQDKILKVIGVKWFENICLLSYMLSRDERHQITCLSICIHLSL